MGGTCSEPADLRRASRVDTLGAADNLAHCLSRAKVLEGGAGGRGEGGEAGVAGRGKAQEE